MNAFDVTLLYLLAAVLGVVVCRYLRLPPILGYLTVGILIGPNALALTQDSAGLRYLAEFGVVFLMFVIGLEFSLTKLKTMGKHVFGLGASQVIVTMVAATLGSLALAWLWPSGWLMDWKTALALGCVMSMSSTAVVIKLTAERAELETEHGKRVVGVLLFQDLAVVPLLVLIPALGESGRDMFSSLSLAVVKAVTLIAILLVGGRHFIRWWLTLVVKRKSAELFMLNLLLITLGLAWLTEHAGLSLALGAFVAGMLISDTEFKHQVETDIRPFHDVLIGLFFITIGMLLDWRIVLERWPLVLALTTLPVIFKFLAIAGLSRLWGAPVGTSTRVGLYLAQAGEFGFVLLTLASQRNLIAPEMLNPILAAMVLSMMATPFIIMYSDAAVARLAVADWTMQSIQMTTIARQAMTVNRHVVICGYGRSGQNLGRMLQGENIPYMALDLDPDRVKQAAAAGDTVVFGDAARLQALMAAGLARASAVVVTYKEPSAAFRVLLHTKEHAPHVPVIVRTVDDHHIEDLLKAGATEVVPEAIEGSLMLASHALALVGVPTRRVIRLVQNQREARYGLLRGYFHGADDDTVNEIDQERLKSFAIPDTAHAIGRSVAQLSLQTLGARLVCIRRYGVQLTQTDEDQQILANDVVVLSGTPGALALAEARLLTG